MKEKIKKLPIIKQVVKIKKGISYKKVFIKDYKLFKKNFMHSKDTEKKLEYYMSWLVHSLEKGMSNCNPRPFGKKKVKELMNSIIKYRKLTTNKSYSYNLAISSLNSYLEFYQKHGWTKLEEYTLVSNFLEQYMDYNKIKVGAFQLHKNDFIKEAKIDYLSFISSRHSVRNYSNLKLADEDIKKAITIALKTPTACNRQMCKIYYIKNKQLNKKIIEYAQGIGGFETKNINFFIVTYDLSALNSIGERNQGLFNSGLLSMNFVNGLHSLGIGSCFIQFANNHKQEEELKQILNISNDERIAVIIAAGYYDDVSKIPYSSRKEIKDIYIER